MEQRGSMLTIFLLVLVAQLEACPKTSQYWKKKCYFKSNKAENYSTALAYCREFKSTLVEIESEEENNFVYNTFVSKLPFQRTYIGVVRQFVDNEGEALNYTKWERHEPNSTECKDDCVEMRKGGYWNNIPCSYKFAFVCEAEASCKLQPCLNGGECVELPKESIEPYKCICKAPFYGRNCEHEFVGCADGWIAFGHYCYRAFPGARPWSNARIVCQKLGANLAVVHSPEENAFLRKTFSKHDFWIGVTECLCGKRCTVDFSRLQYINWATCEPKELGDDEKGCALLDRHSGKWKNQSCKTNRNTVCKRESTLPIALA